MYSPIIREDLVRKLYQHKTMKKNRKPMTYYANLAIVEYLQRNGDVEIPKELALIYQLNESNNKTPKERTG